MRTLDQVRPTLPAHWYYDQEHYSQELDAQSIVVTRLPDRALNAFHNTCRHRGATLCRDSHGRFRNGRVVCPYHTWAYATDGRLVATPGRIETEDFDAAVGGGAKTWTMNGEISLPIIQGPTEEELTQGVTFSSFASSLYVVGHPEFVRSVRIMPTGPESLELTVDWLLPSSYVVRDKQILESILGLTRLVIQQDGEVCELNQQGLHSMRHQSGALIPQEYELWDFHESIRSKLANMEIK